MNKWGEILEKKLFLFRFDVSPIKSVMVYGNNCAITGSLCGDANV